MSLAAGVRLGPYEIVAPIGAGGMGEVYQARDTRLERSVAIKVLPTHLVGNADLRQRFEREAKTVSALNHPHICTLHDVGQDAGVDYLVMEYLEGETLLERLEKGPLPLGQALRHAVEIADALDKAHRSGVVHRDLKPGNIMLTKSGAKLLDFGLAKVAAQQTAAGLSALATAEKPLTEAGTLLGTFQYMAPEQLEGREADPRTDLFAFGAVLYEMVTGQRAFAGKSQASLVSAIMSAEPAPLSAVAPMTPPALERIVRTCLAKDPDDRWQSAHDVAAELRWISEAGSQAGVPAPIVARRKSRERWAWGTAAVLGLIAAAAGGVLYARRAKVAEPTRFVIAMAPELRQMDWPKLSPDGRTIAFLGTSTDGRTSIWLRPLSSLEARVLPGTEGAARPFWSPDGRQLAFFVGPQLKKVPAAGGPPQLVSEGVNGSDGSWSKDGVILFDGAAADPIRRVSAAGGVPTEVVTPDRSQGETTVGWPAFLPDGQHFLYVVTLSQGQSQLKVGTLGSAETKTIGNVEGRVEYSASGHVLYVSQGTLLARPFSTRRLEFTGEPVPVAERVTTPSGGNGFSSFSVSDEGALAYRPGVQAVDTNLIWISADGRELGRVGQPGPYQELALSPDESRLAVGLRDARSQGDDIWVFDLKRNVPTRLTFDGANDIWPVWSPDGQWIAFASNRKDGQYAVYRKRAAGGGEDELLFADEDANIGPTDWSPDGRYVVCTHFPNDGTPGVALLPVDGEKKLVAFQKNAFVNARARMSPDGRWVAYQSNESGRDEIYVQPYPATGARWQISTEGGRTPFWTGRGRQVGFVGLDATSLSAATLTIKGGASIEVELPKTLFKRAQALGGVFRNRWLPSAAGDRFLVNAAAESRQVLEFHVVLDWPAGIGGR